jgi:predicted kinase
MATLLLLTGLPATGKSTLAGRAADALGAAVLGHDWAMAGLRPYGELQSVLDAMAWGEARGVGWSVLWSVARAQLRDGRSVVLDGVARDPEVAGTRSLAAEEGVRCLVVLTSCDDPDVHRGRVEGRRRAIPHWYELTWKQVATSRAGWVPPADVDLVLGAERPLDQNVERLLELLSTDEPR